MQALWEALERDNDGGPRQEPHPAAPPRESPGPAPAAGETAPLTETAGRPHR
jgi:hypothetical protein